MSKYEELSNNQLQTELKTLQAEHESVKLTLIKEYDHMIDVEKQIKKVVDTLNTRGFNIKVLIKNAK